MFVLLAEINEKENIIISIGGNNFHEQISASG